MARKTDYADITKIWKEKFGYVPASEKEEIKEKWAFFKTLKDSNEKQKRQKRN